MADTPPANPFEVPEESALFEMNVGPQPSQFLEAQPSSADALIQSENSGSRFIQIGQVLDGYHIVQLLGQGGMGAVYKAHKDGVDYALKVLLADEIGVSEVARFEREAQAAAVVRHPNIVAVHKLGLSGYCPYIVFDFVEGWSLDKELVEGEPWSLSKALDRLKPVASALDHIHAHNIVHRDLKPANIMIRAYDEAPLLADFGLAHAGQMERLTRTGEILGTPVYMTPEQLTGEPTTAPTDVWPLAIILYEMLTGGKRPFEGASTIALAQSIMLKEPVSIASFVDVDAEVLDYVFEKALAKDSKKRYQSAGDFISDCEKVAAGDFSLSNELGVVELGQRRVKRAGHPVLIGFVLLLFFVLAGALTLLNSQSDQSQMEWQETQVESLKGLQLKGDDIPRHFAIEFFRRLTLLDSGKVESVNSPGADFAADVKAFKDRFETERLGKDKKIVSRLEEKLGELEKTANSWNALVTMRADGDQKAFSLVDKEYQELLVGYQALLKKQWTSAKEAFIEVRHENNDINVVSQFALL
ncbi:MAG: serine/threonine-protein kinase, partial [Planctomycetota bacterium]|nr:serine/threonine-protein kinase [Planctomycetota bacterium]